MKVVFDTNVLISAFITTAGPSAYAIRMALKNFDVILSEYILEEARKKLATKLKAPTKAIKLFETFLRQRTQVIEVRHFRNIHFSDKKDIPILDLLRTASPHYFVTGDSKLLALKKFDHVLILTPREAMEVFHSHL